MGVLDWLNATCNLSGVSLNQGSVPEMVEEHFPLNDGSEPIPFTFTIAVPTADWNPEEHMGDFQLLSPIEEVHACIRCMGSCKPSARKGWANQRRNVLLQFKRVNADDIQAKGFDLREKVGVRAKFVAFTAKQRVEYVMHERSMLIKNAPPSKAGKTLPPPGVQKVFLFISNKKTSQLQTHRIMPSHLVSLRLA